jgi:hypothetical protein
MMPPKQAEAPLMKTIVTCSHPGGTYVAAFGDPSQQQTWTCPCGRVYPVGEVMKQTQVSSWS